VRDIAISSSLIPAYGLINMFAVGMTPAGKRVSFATHSTMLVGGPQTGIKIFNWLGNHLGAGSYASKLPMLFCIAFLFSISNCGASPALCFGVAPFDWQLTDTYFVVAHFHYVLGRRESSS